jgi:hypothetical protein
MELHTMLQQRRAEASHSRSPLISPDKFQQRSGLSWKTGQDNDCIAMFARTGSLDNSSDRAFRASGEYVCENKAYRTRLILSSRRPTVSLAIDLGSITPNNQPDPVVWALGLVRVPLVNYLTKSGSRGQTGYYWSAYQNIDDVVRARQCSSPC